MKVIKKILSIIFNPLNSFSNGKANEKAANIFSKYAILVFILALVITAGILSLGYFVF